MSKIPRLSITALTLGLAAASLVVVAPAASAHPSAHHQRAHHHHARHHHAPPSPSQHVLASGLLSPLRAAVAPDGSTYVSENFAGKIDRVSPSGHRQVVYTDPNGYEVGGLSVAGRNVVFTVTRSDPATMENFDSWLKVLTPSGRVRTVADLYAYEQRVNPDQGTTYGFRSIDPTCAAQWPTTDMGPATYTGAVDSHPYATFVRPDGWTYVADAGGNDILLVSPWGHVRTVAVLPGIPFTITADAATGMGLPSCFVGTTYYFEPVPTDVEVGGHGTLYVTSLPGGPEGTELGARGSIFAINASDHGHYRMNSGHYGHHGGYPQVRRIVTGLAGPTGLAVSPRGDLYVAQLFGNMISKVTLDRHGAEVSDFISTPSPGEVEWTPWGLYFTSNVLSGTDGMSAPAGQLVRYGF